MNDQDRKAADHIELGCCPTCGHFPAQFVEGGGVIARALEMAAPEGFVMVPRDWLDTVFGMAREGCDFPNAAYRWCERIEEIFFAPKTCDQYAQHKQASPPTMLRLAAAPNPADTEVKPQNVVGPIERDEQMDRDYIPLPGGWEVQTKGGGSTFRICNTKNGDRLAIPDSPYLHETLTLMAREIHSACASTKPAADGVTEAEVERAAEALWVSCSTKHKLLEKAGYAIDWASQPTIIKRDYRKQARAALAAARKGEGNG